MKNYIKFIILNSSILFGQLTFAAVTSPSSVVASSTFGSYQLIDLINQDGISGGLNGGTHSNIFDTMWMSDRNDVTPTLTFNLGQVSDITTAHIWQYNASCCGLTRGVNGFDILYSLDNISYTPLSSANLTIATGGAISAQVVPMAVSAQYIRFQVTSNHGNAEFSGLSEVAFDYTIAPATNPDIAVTMTESADPVTAGSGVNNLTHVVTAENITINPATGVAVNVTSSLPADSTLVSATGSGTTTFAGTTWTIGALPASSSESLTLTYTVGSATPANSTIDNTAVLSAINETDDDNSNDTGAASTTVVTQADLSIAMTSPSANITTPGTFTYVIDVSNAGPSDATNVIATDIFDVGFFAVETVGCAEDPSGYQSCNLGSIAPGGMASYSISFDLGSIDGSITNSVSVSSDTSDLSVANNSTASVISGIIRVIPTTNQWGLMILFLLIIFIAPYFKVRNKSA